MLDGAALDGARACAQPALNDFFALGPSAWRALRHGLFALLQGRRAAGRGRCRARLPGPAGRGRVRLARAHRRLHRLLHLDRPRAQHRPPAQARRSDHAQLPVDADRLSRPRLDDRRERPAVPPADGADHGAGRGRADVRPLRAAGLRTRTRHLHRPGQRGRHGDSARARGEPHLRHLPAQRLVGARHPVLGDGAARPLPGEELRDHRLAVDRHAGSAGALPPGLGAAGRSSAAAGLPGERSQPRARRARHPARSLARKREGARRGQRAFAPVDAPASGTSTGASRRWSRTTRWAAAA